MSNLSILEKDRLWTKIKKYIKTVLFLLSFLVFLLIYNVILNVKIYRFLKTPDV